MVSQENPLPPFAPAPHWFWGHLRERREDPLRLFLALHREHGETVRVRMGPMVTLLSLSNPDHVKHVLVDQPGRYHKGAGLDRARPLLGNGLLTSEGSFWMRQRRLAQPAFHKDRVQGFARTMTDAAGALLATWEASAGGERDLHEDMMTLALTVVARTLFSSDVTADTGRIGRALTVALEEANRRMLSLAPRPGFFPTARRRAFDAARATLDGIILRLVAERRRGETRGDDLLQMLLDAKDADTGEQMTDAQLRDEVMTLFLAGHETTANALTWTFLLLAQHPEAEARLHQELDDVLGGRHPTVEDLPRLPYLGWVLNESMRLYPPAWVLARQARVPDEVAGVRIPASRLFFVVMSPWVIHRNPRLWPDPDRFDPLRFSPEQSAGRPKLAYLPFGAGQRMCIGNGFALMEASLVLATLAQRFQPRPLPGAQVQFDPLITLRPKDGLRVRLHSRA